MQEAKAEGSLLLHRLHPWEACQAEESSGKDNCKEKEKAMTIWGVPGRRQKRVVSKCANPLDLLFLLLPPLEQVERLPGGLRWARGWSLIVVIVVQQVVIGCSIIVVGGIVVRGVVVEEIVGRAGHSFSPAQVRQEAPGEGGALQTLCQNHILSHLPHIAKR